MPITINGNTVNTVKLNGAALSEVDYNGAKLWPTASRVSTFVFVLPQNDTTIDLWLTQSTSNAVTVTMDDGAVLTSNQLKANFPYSFSTSGRHTVTVECAEGATWCPGVHSASDITFVGVDMANYHADTKLVVANLGQGLSDDTIYWFAGCTALETAYFTDGIIPASAFLACRSLEYVSLGFVTRIDTDAFRGCSSLTEIVIPSTVLTVSAGAFQQTGLVNVEIAAREVKGLAFEDCAYLEKIWLRNTVQTIGDGTYGPWEGCPANAGLYCEAASLPSGWGSAYDEYDNADNLHYTAAWGQAFAPWILPYSEATLELTSNLTQRLYFAQSEAHGVIVDWGDGSEPETFGGSDKNTDHKKHVNAPHTYASAGTYRIRFTANNGVIWNPGDITRIFGASVGNGLLGGTATKSHVTTPELIDFTFGAGCEVGNGMFCGCTSLTGVELPYNTITIPQYAFYSCTSLSSISLNGIESIQESAFWGCSSLTQIDIPDSVTAIEAYAFAHTGLTQITFPPGVTVLKELVLTSCTNLQRAVMPSVSSIRKQAFYDCSALEYVETANNLERIEEDAFYRCTSLPENIELSATSIAYDAFNGCTQLRKVWLRAAISYIYVRTYEDDGQFTSRSGPFHNCDQSLVLYCEPQSRPSGWQEYFDVYTGIDTRLTTQYGVTSRPW